MGARGKPAKDLAPPGRQIREARKKELGLSSDAFAQLIGYEGSHIRNVERGANGYKGIREACERTAALCEDAHTKKVLDDLVAFLRAYKPDPSKVIDPRRGTVRKQDQERAADHLAGQWSAIWQHLRNGEEILVAETVQVTASGNGRGLTIANGTDSSWLKSEPSKNVEEPGGPVHFLHWSATCRITKNGRWVNGDFRSLSAANNVDGMFRLRLGGFSEVIVGDWVGGSWDSERTHGLLVFGRTLDLAEKRFVNERRKFPDLPCHPT